MSVEVTPEQLRRLTEQLLQLYRNVRLLRTKQRAYFRSREPQLLQPAKSAEQVVDQQLSRLDIVFGEVIQELS